MDINNLPDKDFKMLVIMFMESRRIMEGYNEKFNKETENIRKFQTEVTELKNTTTELKNNQWGSKADLMKQKKGSENLRHGRETHPIRAAKRKKNAKW